MGYQEISDIALCKRALAHAIKGRVLLKDDYDADVDTYLKLTESASVAGDAAPSGTMRFVTLTTALKVVEPGVANTIGSILHSENFTATQHTDDFNIVTTGLGIVKDYTIAAGAYVEPQAVPSVISDIKVVDTGVWLRQDDPITNLLPCVQVVVDGVDIVNSACIQYRSTFRGAIIYIRPMEPSDSIGYTVENDVDTLVNWLYEDQYLGGYVENFFIESVINNRKMESETLNETGLGLSIWELHWVAERERTHTKFTETG